MPNVDGLSYDLFVPEVTLAIAFEMIFESSIALPVF